MGGSSHDSDKNYFFKHEVLESSSFSFSFKKETVLKIINETGALKGKNKDKFQKYLKDIMCWRNAFAHGTLGYDGAKGCFVDYYQGKQQKEYLNDGFWKECEDTFNKSHECINTVIHNLHQGT